MGAFERLRARRRMGAPGGRVEYQGHHEGGQEDGRDGAHTAGRNRSDREWKDNGDPEMPTNGTGSHEPEECKRGGRVGKREVHKQRPQPSLDKINLSGDCEARALQC